jgi:hypothetical protein
MAAKEIGSNFFATRHREYNVSSQIADMLWGVGRLQTLTLKARLNKGLPFPFPRETSKRDAEFNTLTFHMLPPKTMGEEPELVHLERERQEKLCHDVLQSTLHHVLQHIISITEDGLHVSFRLRTGGKSGCMRAVVPRVGTRRSERLAQQREMESTVD